MVWELGPNGPGYPILSFAARVASATPARSREPRADPHARHGVDGADPTGGGRGNNMVYLSGVPHHKVASEDIISHIVRLVEKKSDELKIK